MIKDENFNNPNMKEYENYLTYLKKIDKVLKQLGIREDLELDNISEIDEQKLHILDEAFMHDTPVDINNNGQELMITNFKISNLVILLAAIRQNNGLYLIKNFFNFKIHNVEGIINGNKFPVSQFAPMTEKNFLEISNINYDYIFNDIKTIKPSNEYYDWLIHFILKMILAFDMNKNFEIIKQAFKYYKWLETVYNNESVKYIHFINHLQIKKRLKLLNTKDLELLQEFVEDHKESEMNLTAAYILLDNFNAAALHFKRLTEEQQKDFISFPIHNLWKNFN